MKLSVMLAAFHGPLVDGSLAPRALVEAIVGGGLGAVEPMLSCLDDAPAPWQELLDLCREAGLQVSCLDIGADLVGDGPEARAAALATVARGLDVCVETDCPVALIYGTGPAVGMSNDEGRMIYSQSLAHCAALAGARRVTACIEDYGGSVEFACRSDHVREVVTGAGPDARVVWDNGNFILADELPMHAYEVLRDLSVHAHIKDFRLDETGQASLKTPSGKAYRGAGIGQGDCQVAACVAALKRDGYEGCLSLEVGAPAVEQMLAGAEFVRRAWDEA